MQRKEIKMIKFQIIIVQRLDELEKYEDDWNKLLIAYPGAGPTQSFAWVKNFFQYKLKDGAKWICLFAYEDNLLVGIYPLIFSKRKRIAGFIIQSFSLPYHYLHTYRSDGLILSGYEKVLELFLKEIRRKFGVFPLINVRGIPEISSSCRCLDVSRKRISFLKKYSGAEKILATSNSYEAYLSQLNSKFRREIKRQERRLAETLELNYLLDCAFQDNEKSFREFIEIEDGGWKGLKETSIKKNPSDTFLFKYATRNFSENGWMVWNFLKSEKTILAAQLGVKLNGVIYLWKIGFREEFSKVAPGNLLLFSFIEKCFKDPEIKEVNFLSEMKWLKPWDLENRKLYNIIIFPKVFLVSNLFKIYFKIKHS